MDDETHRRTETDCSRHGAAWRLALSELRFVSPLRGRPFGASGSAACGAIAGRVLGRVPSGGLRLRVDVEHGSSPRILWPARLHGRDLTAREFLSRVAVDVELRGLQSQRVAQRFRWASWLVGARAARVSGYSGGASLCTSARLAVETSSPLASRVSALNMLE